jgi:histidinol-phosphate/aromatic aminotransferase/cobyric acid decarboxylase-like protein
MNEELLNSHLRITIGTEAQNLFVIDAIKEFFKNPRN